MMSHVLSLSLHIKRTLNATLRINIINMLQHGLTCFEYYGLGIGSHTFGKIRELTLKFMLALFLTEGPIYIERPKI
jgi:hypothetical protein